ncbi:MAG: HlyD family secretion protein [Cyanobacteriota bacterium]
MSSTEKTSFPTPAADDEDLPLRSRWANRLVVTVASLLLAAAGLLLLRACSTRSRDAVIEARQIAVTSPIDGVLTRLDVRSADRVARGQRLLVVSNPRASRQRLAGIRSQLHLTQAELLELRRREARLRAIAADSGLESRSQVQLQLERQTQELNTLLAREKKAVQELAFAGRHHERYQTLFAQGAVAADVVDRTRTSREQAQAELEAARHALRAQRAVLEAARLSLTLTATRGGDDPEIKARADQLQLGNVQDQIRTKQVLIDGLQRQLQEAEKQWGLDAAEVIRSPVDGVVWNTQLSEGASVTRTATVLSLLDCQDRWINAYVKETNLIRIRIGQKASVSLVGTRQVLQGRVVYVRSGIGRTKEGTDQAPLLPINLYREAQVKVALDPDPQQDASRFCLVGHTGEVRFL